MKGPDQVVFMMVWSGITIEVSYNPNDIMSHAHLELRSEGKAHLPVTDTGYRSEFLPRGKVEEHGGPEAYVTLWLDGSAKSTAWKKRQITGEQLSLF